MLKLACAGAATTSVTRTSSAHARAKRASRFGIPTDIGSAAYPRTRKNRPRWTDVRRSGTEEHGLRGADLSGLPGGQALEQRSEQRDHRRLAGPRGRLAPRRGEPREE